MESDFEAYELAASVTLHGLRLAVTSVVVGPAAFVARGRAWTDSATSKPSTETTTISGPRDWSATA